MSENKTKITGIALTGSFENEGHSVIFTISESNKDKIKIRESFLGNSWQTHGRNWSTEKTVSLIDAIEEQEKLIKYRYQRTN
jgi:hypothetical protein